jgi:RecA/RadA recombinase
MAPLPAPWDRLVEELERLALAAPCFAHMRIETGGRMRDLLLGPRSRIGGGVTVLDWQEAPLAEVFFACSEGEDYEIDVDGRELSGTLHARHLLGFDRGALVEIRGVSARVHRPGPSSPWMLSALDEAPLFFPEGGRARERSVSTVEPVLDEAQRAIVALPSGRAVLVLGEAGFGKTTVALHRLRAVRRTGGVSRRAAVIVPSEGLRRYTESLLSRLGEEDVTVWLYDRWAAAEARRAFPWLPSRESEDATAGVVRLKRHPSLGAAIAKQARAGVGRAVSRVDLLELFGDRLLLDEAASASGGAIGEGAVGETLEHTRVQFSATTEEEYAHVDADRLKTVDERAIDEGTPTGDAGSVDAEDYAVLFELDRLRATAKGARAADPRPFGCIVVDEAQELAPLELGLVGRALAPGGTLVVAGDAAQQLDAGASFVDWEHTMAALGQADHRAARLEVSYRSPPGITALARRILDEKSASPVDDESVVARLCASPCHLAATLLDELRVLRARDPGATVAVICRTPERARRLARVLGFGLEIRLAEGGDFELGPAIHVCSIEEVRGLEFDYVAIPDADPHAFPDEPAARRALYLAVTRAAHRLLLLADSRFSPLLPLPSRG